LSQAFCKGGKDRLFFIQAGADDEGKPKLFPVCLVVGGERFHFLRGELSESSSGLFGFGFGGEDGSADEVRVGVKQLKLCFLTGLLNDLDHGGVQGTQVGIRTTLGGLLCHPGRVFKSSTQPVDEFTDRQGVEFLKRCFQGSVPGTVGHRPKIFPYDQCLVTKQGDATRLAVWGAAAKLFFEWSVVEIPIAEGIGMCSGIVDPADTGPKGGGVAHATALGAGVENAAGEIVGTEPTAGFTNGDDLAVGAGIASG